MESVSGKCDCESLSSESQTSHSESESLSVEWLDQDARTLTIDSDLTVTHLLLLTSYC